MRACECMCVWGCWCCGIDEVRACVCAWVDSAGFALGEQASPGSESHFRGALCIDVATCVQRLKLLFYASDRSWSRQSFNAQKNSSFGPNASTPVAEQALQTAQESPKEAIYISEESIQGRCIRGPVRSIFESSAFWSARVYSDSGRGADGLGTSDLRGLLGGGDKAENPL